MACAIIILITPGQVHRMAYKGRDDPRAHDWGTRLLSSALAPLAIGISADYYVAVGKIAGYNAPARIAAILVLLLLLTVWYVIPWTIRARAGRSHAMSTT